MTYGLDDVPGTRLSLCSDHRRAFSYSPKRFPEITSAADKRNFELVFVHVMFLIGRRQHLALVDEVDAERFQDLGFSKVSNAYLGHNRDGDCRHDFADFSWRGHAGNSALGADVGGDSF